MPLNCSRSVRGCLCSSLYSCRVCEARLSAVAVRPLFPTCRSALLVVSQYLIQTNGIQLSNHTSSPALASFLGEHEVGRQCVMARCLTADCMSCDRRFCFATNHCCEKGCGMGRKGIARCNASRKHNEAFVRGFQERHVQQC